LHSLYPEGKNLLLSFKNFSFRYRSQNEPTLFNINLDIFQGEKILILGPSGCGKSTLIHCINGIIPHAFKGEITGEVSLSGKNIAELDIFEISKIAGTVLQDTDGQFVGLSAAEDIAFALENDCVSVQEMHSRTFEAASLVDMNSHLDKSPHDLSGGQKQRISMAGILVDNVDLLLFDEPLANLDPATGKEAVELIDQIHRKEGKTILIVEHRLEDVLHRSVDRVVVMDKGRIISIFKPSDLLSSDILIKTGIREPLYISALKYAGLEIKPEMNPQHIDNIIFNHRFLLEWDSKNNDAIQAQSGFNTCLDVRDLHFRYSQHGEEVLKGVSFSVAQGECAALVGKNGSGKSTLAKCICGFLKPDKGSFFFKGLNLNEFSIMERAEKIAFVMQNPNQMISFPMIFDEIAFGLKNRRFTENEIRERTNEALSVCGLYPFRNWPVNALSYGQKKRLTIASIIVLRPSFIILDEPTAGQDYRHYTEFMEFLLGLNRDLGLSLLLITHDMHLMLEYTTRTVVLSDGSCVADREPYLVLTDEDITKRASLKKTSLYELAMKAGLNDPQGFVGRYIAYDRKKREQEKNVK